MGMNELGVGHFANALGNARRQPGLTHYPIKRRCFEMRSVAECVELLRQHRACSPANMVFCDGQGNIGDVEIRPDAVVEYDDEHPCRRLHTNHYLSEAFAPYEDGNNQTSRPRLDRLRELVMGAWGTITVDTLKGFLADHQGDPGAICSHGAGASSYSICGYIADPGAGVLHVRRGQGCTGTWTEYPV
jgi:hypothetical protein